MPKRILRWASYYVGNRGVAAFILGLIWFLIGLSMLLDATNQDLPDSVLPMWMRSLFWVVPGVYAMAWTALTPIWRHDDHNVWALLMLGPTARFVTYIAAGIMNLFDLGHPDSSGAHVDYRGPIIGILVWLAVLALVWTCAAGLDRLPPVRTVRPGRRSGGQ